MTPIDVVDLDEVGRGDLAVVGGKAAGLGELRRLDGIRVPAGWCVTASAYRRVVATTPDVADLVERLATVPPADGPEPAAVAAELRGRIEGVELPPDLVDEVGRRVERSGGAPWAVRSSATTEDLAGASAAGQHDSYLGVLGVDAVLDHIRRCWASLFTDRAVAYRAARGVDHRQVAMAVVVQRVVAARAAGVLFTADPVASDRTVSVVEAVAGTGDALVAGRAAPDTYRVRDGRLLDGPGSAGSGDAPGSGRGARRVGGTGTLTVDEVVELAALGGRLEEQLGGPQDVEWCLDGDGFHVVQSRPVTTLFPVPERDDDVRHVYVSVGHQQMMTDPMTPMGLSIWQMTAGRPMFVAGNRLFVDVTDALGSPPGRAALVAAFRRSDPLVGDALERVVASGFLPPADRPAGPAAGGSAQGGGAAPTARGRAAPTTPTAAPEPLAADPALVEELVRRTEGSLAAARARLEGATGVQALDLVVEDVAELRKLLADPQLLPVLMSGMDAARWLDEHVLEWLGDRNAADRLSRSAPGNVTSQMGLDLLDVADVVRARPSVMAFLRGVGGDDDVLDALGHVEGGAEAREAVVGYLERYGMRCVGEIDVGRPRWIERPGALVPLLLADVDHFGPGESARRFAEGERVAASYERDVLARLRELPDGEAKAQEAKRAIDRLRTFIGYREHPKYGMVQRYLLYRRVVLGEADRLVADGVLDDREDAFLLTFDELREVVRTGWVEPGLVRRRRAELDAAHALRPPRVLTSDGRTFDGHHVRADVPPGALPGVAVSAGTVEGRARVVLDVAGAVLEPGDVLVTPHTDPSWSPLFVAAAGLVTEVGGVMTHGAVVAREYGLPAVVGVERATELIADGRRIRVHGADGYVELL